MRLSTTEPSRDIVDRDNGHAERRSPSADQDIPTKSHPGLVHLYPSVTFGQLVPWIFLEPHLLHLYNGTNFPYVHKSIVKVICNGDKEKLSTWYMAAFAVILMLGQGLGARASCLECFYIEF